MKKLVTTFACTAALATTAVAAPGVVGSSTAGAATLCTHNWVNLGVVNATTTPQVAATNTCANMWSVQTDWVSDYVKGQYRKNGSWWNSEAGWQWTTTDPAAKKIVLDLVDGEPLRAWLRYGPRQAVEIWY